MDARKFLAPAMAVFLLVGVGGGIWISNARLKGTDVAQLGAQSEQAKEVTVRGLIGSEKEAFFADPRVQHALASHGLTVTVEKAGSRAIAARYDASKYDFGFPSGAPAAVELRLKAHAAAVFNPFYTPMVLASWRPIAEILVANGIATRDGEASYVVNMPALLELAQKGVRWRDLKSSQSFASGKAVLINSTDVRTSNSAAMYLALASYFANNQQVVQSQGDVDRVLPLVAPLFLRQGFQEQSSTGPFVSVVVQ